MSEKPKTWDERILDIILSGFSFGLVVIVLDLLGVTLNWETGVGIVILSLLAAVLALIIGGIVYAVRYRRKTDG